MQPNIVKCMHTHESQQELGNDMISYSFPQNRKIRAFFALKGCAAIQESYSCPSTCALFSTDQELSRQCITAALLTLGSASEHANSAGGRAT